VKVGNLVKCHRRGGFDVIGIIVSVLVQHEASWAGIRAYKVLCTGHIKTYTSAGIRELNESR